MRRENCRGSVVVDGLDWGEGRKEVRSVRGRARRCVRRLEGRARRRALYEGWLGVGEVVGLEVGRAGSLRAGVLGEGWVRGAPL